MAPGTSKSRLIGGLRDYLMIVVGLAIFSFGFTAFILPEKVVMGGVSGLASLVYFKFGIPVAYTNYGINVLLLLLALRFVGRVFVVRTIFGATVVSVLIGVMQPIFTEPLATGQPFMNVVLGAALAGMGVGIAFVHNGSSGGFDIVAAMVSKYMNVSIGRVLRYVDLIIVSSSYLLFQSVEKMLFGYIVLLIMSTMCDYMINSHRQAVQFTIISKKWEEIADAINTYANRGCTVIRGTGWYTKNEVMLLMVLCRKMEANTVFRIIKAIDGDAFVSQGNVNGVYGVGFDKVKVRLSHHGRHEPGGRPPEADDVAQKADKSAEKG